jgi:hypothetical protein
VDARKGGSNVGTELSGLNTHVAPAPGDDDDWRARRDNGTESGSVGREAGFTRRGIVGGPWLRSFSTHPWIRLTRLAQRFDGPEAP